MEITSSGNCGVWKFVGTHCIEVAVRTPGASPCAPPRAVACATPNLTDSKTLHFVDRGSIVQRWVL